MGQLSGIGVKYLREFYAIEDAAGLYKVFFEAGNDFRGVNQYLFVQHNGWCIIVEQSLHKWHDYKCICARLVAMGVYTQRSAHIPLEHDSVRRYFTQFFGS